MPNAWKKFYVTLIPKNDNGNDVESLVDTNRPISICNDYLKLFQKIMATRLNNIILKYKILHPAQQGFIRNGSINNCLTTLLNILEDQKQKNILRNSNFYLISYDLTKAYDSIQFCSFRPSLERFNLPEKFIKLMENILFKMSGSIKTFFGLTDQFEINKSIRQGDPIAPLLFVLWIVHDGIYTSKKMGYKFNSHHQCIASLGFADDLIVFGETWNDIYITHEWIREFIHTHGGQINQNKTAYIISNGIPNDKRWLHSCSGNEQIIPIEKDHYFKYLGLNVNLNLDWKKQTQIMNNVIIQWCNKLLSTKLSLLKGIELYKITLLPRLDIGLTFANIPDKILNKWSRKIITTLFRLDNHYDGIGTLSLNAFAETVNCQLISERYWNNKIKEILYNLNSNNYDYISTINRLSDITNENQLNKLNLYQKSLKHKYSQSRFARLIEYLKKYNIFIKQPNPLNIKILNWIKFIQYKLTNLNYVQIFTDGSTLQNHKISGIGIYIVQLDLNIHMSIETNGNNYMAEIMAITICVVAANRAKIENIEIYTDSKSTIESICNLQSDRKWVRTPLRGWVALLSQNLNHKINLNYVRSHTNSNDFFSNGNNRADALAKLTSQNKFIELGLPDYMGAYLFSHDII